MLHDLMLTVLKTANPLSPSFANTAANDHHHPGYSLQQGGAKYAQEGTFEKLKILHEHSSINKKYITHTTLFKRIPF